jgi:Flp pilus assembly protein TadD
MLHWRFNLLLAGIACASTLSGCARMQADECPLAASPPASLPEPFARRPAPMKPALRTRPDELEQAREQERRGEFAVAETTYWEVGRKNPRDPEVYHRLGVLAARQGHFAEAQQHFNTARELAPASAELFSDIGYTCFLQQRTSEAERNYRRALILAPRHTAACNNLGHLLARERRYEESLAIFRRAGTEAEAYAKLAAISGQCGDRAMAEESARKAISLDSALEPLIASMVPRSMEDAPGVADGVRLVARQQPITLRSTHGQEIHQALYDASSTTAEIP